MKMIVAAAFAFAAVSAGALDLVPQPVSVKEMGGKFECRGEPAKVASYSVDASIPKEGYRLVVAADGVKIASSDEAGRFYAEQTLKSLAVKKEKPKGSKEEDSYSVPCVEIEDAPRYPWRGVHLDECRHFFGKEIV